MKPEKLQRNPTGFTRRFQDRCFAILLSIVFGVPTGWGLWLYLTLNHSEDNPDRIIKLFFEFGMDIVGTIFAISILGIVWAIFMPHWIERMFVYLLKNLWKGLMILFVIVLIMFVIGLCGLF
jgi:hypothetical protein